MVNPGSQRLYKEWSLGDPKGRSFTSVGQNIVFGLLGLMVTNGKRVSSKSCPTTTHVSFLSNRTIWPHMASLATPPSLEFDKSTLDSCTIGYIQFPLTMDAMMMMIIITVSLLLIQFSK